jgi:hypothetical protein
MLTTTFFVSNGTSSRLRKFCDAATPPLTVDPQHDGLDARTIVFQLVVEVLESKIIPSRSSTAICPTPAKRKRTAPGKQQRYGDQRDGKEQRAPPPNTSHNRKFDPLAGIA